MKKCAIVNFAYATMIIVVFSLQYNEWFFDLFRPEWWHYSQTNKEIYLANNYFWIWLSLNIFIAFFLITYSFFKFWDRKVYILWQSIIVASVFLTGVFLPYIYATFLDWLGWFVYFIIFLLSLFWVVYSIYYDKKPLIKFEEKI